MKRNFKKLLKTLRKILKKISIPTVLKWCLSYNGTKEEIVIFLLDDFSNDSEIFMKIFRYYFLI